jgi:hypothetical protein
MTSSSTAFTLYNLPIDVITTHVLAAQGNYGVNEIYRYKIRNSQKKGDHYWTPKNDNRVFLRILLDEDRPDYDGHTILHHNKKLYMIYERNNKIYAYNMATDRLRLTVTNADLLSRISCIKDDYVDVSDGEAYRMTDDMTFHDPVLGAYVRGTQQFREEPFTKKQVPSKIKTQQVVELKNFIVIIEKGKSANVYSRSTSKQTSTLNQVPYSFDEFHDDNGRLVMNLTNAYKAFAGRAMSDFTTICPEIEGVSGTNYIICNWIGHHWIIELQKTDFIVKKYVSNTWGMTQILNVKKYEVTQHKSPSLNYSTQCDILTSKRLLFKFQDVERVSKPIINGQPNTIYFIYDMVYHQMIDIQKMTGSYPILDVTSSHILGLKDEEFVVYEYGGIIASYK